MARRRDHRWFRRYSRPVPKLPKPAAPKPQPPITDKEALRRLMAGEHVDDYGQFWRLRFLEDNDCL